MSKALHYVSASVLALVTGLLPLSQSVAAGTSQGTLTLKTRYTKATCQFTLNGATSTGMQEVSMPSVTTAALSQSSAEWKGPVVPLNLGLRCPAGPETNVTMSMEVVPGVSDTGTGTGNNVIASKKLRDNSEGPDLLLVNTGSGNSAVSFQPVLELPGTGACQARSINGADCLQLSGSGPDYSIPLGLQMLLPAQSSFSTPEMRKPGIWSATVTLNIRYQ